MDDFPAGPTGPGPRRPPLSVVVPVRDGARELGRCLRGLRDSSWADYELIVVDDGSTDGSAEVAATFGARVVRQMPSKGPASARNLGVTLATAPIVFFLDADVVPHREALGRALRRLDADPGLAALFGSYDDRPAAPGLVSQYRNLLHHYIHQRGEFEADARQVRTFWTGCGAIRRRAFLDLGGFDPHLYRRPAIEDIELGYRLSRAGLRIVLARDVLATHLKHWSLFEVVRTDIFRRGVPWMLLLKRSKVAESDLNVSLSQRASVASTGLGILALLGTPWLPGLLVVALACLVAILGLNLDFYRFLAGRKGRAFAAASVPLHIVYFCCCGLSVAIAEAILRLPGRRATTSVRPANRRPDPETEAAIPMPKRARTRRLSRWTKP